MTLPSFTRLSFLAVLTLAACKGDKVQPDAAGGKADSALTLEQREAKRAKDNAMNYAKRQQSFADSVLGNTASAAKVAEKFGKQAEVGSVKLRDAVAAYVAKTPECFKNGRDVDPYLAGTASFYVHMSVVGSDVVRVQESTWTSQAGNIVDKCFNDAARKWKFDMGLTKPGHFVVQVQFK